MFSFSPYKIFKTLFLIAFCFVIAVKAQSTNSDYPTPVTTSEIKGVIMPRDVGDSRATRYFYTFTGTPGDLNFIIESDNINGDVDIFTISNLRPLFKISLFDLGGKTITSGSIYLRKREPLLLRIEAKTASEKRGTYQMKFSGGFEPIADAGKQPEEPKVTNTKNTEGTIRVNSAGARIEEPAPAVKETPTASKETTAKKTEDTATPPKTNETVSNTTPSNTKTTTTTTAPTIKKETPAARRKRLAEERAEAIRKRKEEEAIAAAERKKKQEEAAEQRKREAIAKAEADKARKEAESANNTNTASATPKTSTAKSKTNTPSAKTKETATAKAKETAPDPMASVLLIVETKDGQRIERTMNEVRRVNVEKGILVVVFMDGKTERIPMTEVLKFTIEPQ